MKPPFVMTLVCLIALAVRAEEYTPPAACELASQILSATGVKGGLVVHLGCGDGQLTTALHPNDRYLVQGLDTDAANIPKARQYIRNQGLYGPVSVQVWDGKRLPYADTVVNLLVISGSSAVEPTEILRVLAPQGTALHLSTNQPLSAAKKWVKPRPETMDQWTHFLHDASNNPVARDVLVAPPKNLQWVAGPKFARHHDHMASTSAMVSADGRVLAIMDEGPTASILLPAKWVLVARDAFNGKLLWKRDLPTWHSHLWPNKSGPANMPRRLVAVGDKVYVTLGLDAPLVELNAATGETLRTFAGTKATEEVIFSEGVLFLVVNESPEKAKEAQPPYDDIKDLDIKGRETPWNSHPRTLLAVKVEDGQPLWQINQRILPLTLIADRQGVYLHDGEKVLALDRGTGRQRWQSAPLATPTPLITQTSATMLVSADVVLITGDQKSVSAFSTHDGRKLWTADLPASGYVAPSDLYVIGGQVWMGDVRNLSNKGTFIARDLRTGEVKKQFAPDTDIYWFHRCYRGKATEKYLLPARTGIEMVDFQAEHWVPNHWVRGGCIYGVMPCNGLLYAPPNACSCYMEAKLTGWLALSGQAAGVTASQPVKEEGRLERGPGYATHRPLSTPAASQEDWPTYRHDAARSGCATTALPTELKPLWQQELKGRLSAPVVAEGKLLVAEVDTHTLHALDARTGQPCWTFTASGRVDSPPTLWQGRVLFGCADGWVYALEAEKGALLWRYRAAPAERLLIAHDQLESAWPVSGSVLVSANAEGQPTLYCLAGRSMFLDGGLRLLQLDPATGQKRGETILDDLVPDTGQNLQSKIQGLNMPVALPDVLASDGKYLYMRSQRFTLGGERQEMQHFEVKKQAGEGAHLFSPHGFLDDSWFHRSYWLYGKAYVSGAASFGWAGQRAPGGRLMVMDDERVYAFGFQPPYYRWVSPLEYHLYCTDKTPAVKEIKVVDGMRNDGTIKTRPEWHWSQNVPLLVRAMALAADQLVLAGPPDVVDEVAAYHNINDPKVQAQLAEQAAALEGRHGAILRLVATKDGQTAGEYKLDAPPVFDGLLAAHGRVYLSTSDGKVLCLGRP